VVSGVTLNFEYIHLLAVMEEAGDSSFHADNKKGP